MRELSLTTPRFRTPLQKTTDGAVLQVTSDSDTTPNPNPRNELRPRFW